MDMTVKQGQNKFYVDDDEEDPLSLMTYVHNAKTQIIIDHTEVSDELRGEGIGDRLLEAVVRYARKKCRSFHYVHLQRHGLKRMMTSMKMY